MFDLISSLVWFNHWPDDDNKAINQMAIGLWSGGFAESEKIVFHCHVATTTKAKCVQQAFALDHSR